MMPFWVLRIQDIAQTLKNAQLQFTNWADPKKNPRREVKNLLERLDSGFFKNWTNSR